MRNVRAWYFKVCFNNNNYYIYTYIISGLLGMGDKRKKKWRESETHGKYRGGFPLHASIDPMVQKPPIVTKFQTVIVFNVVNTFTESDFDPTIGFYCTSRSVLFLNFSLDFFWAFPFAFIYFKNTSWKWVSCWVIVDRHIIFI